MKEKYAQFLLEKTIKDYNLIAKEFSRTRENIWPEMNFLFRDFLKKEDKVLDLGCGNGRWFEVFQKYKIHYVGIDGSEELIKIAKEKYPQATFKVSNVLNLPFQNNDFEKVYSIAVFHQIPSKNFRLQFLKEVKRVLKPGGFLILTVWRFHHKKTLLSLIKYTILKLLGKTDLDFGDVFYARTKRYYHVFSKRELISLVRESGLEVQKIGIIKNQKGNRQNIYLIAQNP